MKAESIEMVFSAIIGIIVLIGLVSMFYYVLGSSECDKLSNATAVQLADAINSAALDSGVSPWYGQGIPPDDKKDNYVMVSVQLCEKNFFNTFNSAFGSVSPSYILTYETMPEGGYAWSETQPFGAGAFQSVQNYLLMKYGPKIFTYGSTLIKKMVVGTGKAIWKGLVSFKILKIKRYIENSWLYKKIKSIGNRITGSKAQKAVQETVPDRLNAKNYPKKYKSVINDLKKMVVDGKMSEEDALVKAGLIEEIDGKAKTFIDKLDGKEKYIVKSEYTGVMNMYIENTGDAAELIKGTFYIPSRWNKIEKFKTEVWYPLKYRWSSYWKNNRVKKWLVEQPKALYKKIKGGWNKVFNYEQTIDTADTPHEMGLFKNYMVMNRDETRLDIIDNWDALKGSMEEVTGKVFTKAEDIADEDVIKFINKYERYADAQLLVRYANRQTDKIASEAAKSLGIEIKERASKIKDLTTDAEKMVEFRQLQTMLKTDWNNLPIDAQTDWITKFSAGYTGRVEDFQAEAIYNYARASAIKNGVINSNYVIDPITGAFDSKWLASQADKVKGDMLAARVRFPMQIVGKESVVSYIVAPIATENTVSNSLFKVTTWGMNRYKRGALLDLNRVGTEVYDPITGRIPLSVAPYNLPSPFQSKYALKESLRRASEIQEGGCSQKSICKIQRGEAAGSTETSTSYLLDRRFPQYMSVKLWRPKPDAWIRMPIGFNTIPFYLSVTENPRFHVVSPCFGLAKVWKNGDTVYVNIEKSKKCDVSGCGDDTPNYCYASEEYIWGEDVSSKGNLITTGDAPSEWVYYPIYAACMIGCQVGTMGTGLEACRKGCEYGTIGALFANAVAATEIYRTQPAWRRQEVSWGYWNFQKAGDICDTIDMISGFVPKPKAALKTTQQAATQTTRFAKLKKTVGLNAGDICYGLQLIGDTSLAWPEKVPVGEIWRRNAVLDENCMKESAPNCAWLIKCSTDLECQTTFGAGWTCVRSVCKK